MKETMTSFDIAAATLELTRALQGARINNIYQINSTILLLKLHQSSNPALNLLIEVGRRVHLTSYAIDKPLTPSSFCSALRKYLLNGLIQKIRQIEFERIISLDVKTKHGDFRLIIELFGKGNIILVNQQNQIVHALTYRRMRDRNIIRGEVFRLPPTAGLDPSKASLEHLKKLREQGRTEVVIGLTKLLALGGLYAEEVLLNSGIDKNMPCEQLEDGQISKILQEITAMFSKLSTGELNPSIVVDENGNWIDVIPFPLNIYKDKKLEAFSSFNEALDEYFTKLSGEKTRILRTEQIMLQRKEQERILRQQLEQLEGLKKSSEINRKLGDLIFSHLHDLQTLISIVAASRRSGESLDQTSSKLLSDKQKGRVPAIYFERFSPGRREFYVSVDGMNFPLDFGLTAQENAARFYEKAKKADQKIKGVLEAIEVTKSKLESLQKQHLEIKTQMQRPIIKKRVKAWYEKFHWFYTSEGMLAIGGRDAVTNEIIIKRYMEPSDLVFHADFSGAPFVLLKTGGKQPSAISVSEAAQFEVSYSRAWRSALGSADVYWVKPEQISKSPPAGEYLRKGMFMIYGQRNYIRGVPLRLAIGIKKTDDQLYVIGGPPSAIQSQTNIYIELVPVKRVSKKLAGEIRLKLAEKAGNLRGQVLALPIEEFQPFIPAGNAEIMQ
ncbi:NFACT family protein [Candidatus Bathyarchaeota archaeon]|nr:NFACT family protein [Candidatus Bathyarchaeota archaeon]